jgi:PKD repeat protein
LTPTHQYGDNGGYTVTLTVTDDDGGVGIDTLTVTVNNVLTVTVNNVSPYVVAGPDQTMDEGVSEYFELATFTDPGWLDTHEAIIDWGDGTAPVEGDVTESDGSGTVSGAHIYGDNGLFYVIILVIDDDGGMDIARVDITVNNVAPTINPFGPFTVDEGSIINIDTIAEDPGSDDLIFTWEFELGHIIINAHFNDGIGPDPYPSPWGTFPFIVTDAIEYIYGDDGVYTLTLHVEDDDGAVTSHMTTITVNNVAPTVEAEAYMLIDFTLRLTGEKWHDVNMSIYADGELIDWVRIVRQPGDPDDQSATLYDVKCDVTKTITVIVEYTPWNDPINGFWLGANPVQVDLTFEDGTVTTLHHTFNVNHPGTYIWNIDVNQYFAGHEITFEATAIDPGSDDLTFTWEFSPGDIVENRYYNDGFGPDLPKSPWGTYPFEVTDILHYGFPTLVYHTVTLTVTDDDGGVTVITLIINLL